jgi:hypothetical protein
MTSARSTLVLTRQALGPATGTGPGEHLLCHLPKSSVLGETISAKTSQEQRTIRCAACLGDGVGHSDGVGRPRRRTDGAHPARSAVHDTGVELICPVGRRDCASSGVEPTAVLQRRHRLHDCL